MEFDGINFVEGGYLRKATAEEIVLFEKKLYPLQDEIFEIIQTDRFYLSGGTCLSRFYYQHRYSEDLDFFFDGFNFSKEEFEILVREIINRMSNQMDMEITVDGDFFKRGFVRKNDLDLKIEFVFENYKNVGIRKKIKKIVVDSKENIATNKLTALYDRKTVKDFVDLYYLLQDIEFDNIVEWTKYKIVPLDYENTLLALSEENFEGTPLRIKNLAYTEFKKLADELKKKMIEHAKKR